MNPESAVETLTLRGAAKMVRSHWYIIAFTYAVVRGEPLLDAAALGLMVRQNLPTVESIFEQTQLLASEPSLACDADIGIPREPWPQQSTLYATTTTTPDRYQGPSTVLATTIV